MNSRKSFLKILLVFAAAVFYYSCSSISIIDDPHVAKEKVNEWLNQLAKNPNDADALKNLSIYYVQTNQQEKAAGYLYSALKVLPDDPALIFYNGLDLEFFNKTADALKNYQQYVNVPESSQYKELMEGRYLWLKRKQAFSDVDSLVKIEKSLSMSSVSDSTLAVFPLIYKGINKDYFPLSRGFSEMVSIDLAKVKSLTVLERIRIQAVLDELKFSQSSIVDQATAPRAGKLLKAGTIVSGDYDVADDKEFKINLGSWDVRTSQRKSWVSEKGNLQDLFTIQKEIVFAFLQKNGIELTQSEKESIAYIPTQNLQAFLSFSKGLLQEDAGNFNEASSFFQKAVEIDPHFNVSKSKLNSSISISKVNTNKASFAANLKKADPLIKIVEIQITDNRTQTLQQNIVSGFVQGIDSREAAQEESNKRSLDMTLPLPPPPPPVK